MFVLLREYFGAILEDKFLQSDKDTRLSNELLGFTIVFRPYHSHPSRISNGAIRDNAS